MFPHPLFWIDGHLRSLWHFIMLLQKRYSGFKNCSFVHFPIIMADHRAEFGYQHIELVSSLLLGEVPSFSFGFVLFIIVLHVISGDRERGPTHGLHDFSRRHDAKTWSLIENQFMIIFSIEWFLALVLINVTQLYFIHQEGRKWMHNHLFSQFFSQICIFLI